jgi:hypothetical protein
VLLHDCEVVTGADGLLWAEPESVPEPEPLESEPLESDPLESEPLEPEPLESDPLEPEPLESEPLEPEPLEPEPLESEPLEPELLPLGPLALCVAVLSPSPCVLVDDPEDVGVVVDAVEEPPLPSAATASQAATKVASTPVVTRRRTFRTRCVTGEAGGGMASIVADEAWILLGIRSAPDKGAAALRFLFVGS